jgi:hypothetical protein
VNGKVCAGLARHASATKHLGCRGCPDSRAERVNGSPSLIRGIVVFGMPYSGQSPKTQEFGVL